MAHLTSFEVALVIASAVSFVYGFINLIKRNIL